MGCGIHSLPIFVRLILELLMWAIANPQKSRLKTKKRYFQNSGSQFQSNFFARALERDAHEETIGERHGGVVGRVHARLVVQEPERVARGHVLRCEGELLSAARGDDAERLVEPGARLPLDTAERHELGLVDLALGPAQAPPAQVPLEVLDVARLAHVSARNLRRGADVAQPRERVELPLGRLVRRAPHHVPDVEDDLRAVALHGDVLARARHARRAPGEAAQAVPRQLVRRLLLVVQIRRHALHHGGERHVVVHRGAPVLDHSEEAPGGGHRALALAKAQRLDILPDGLGVGLERQPAGAVGDVEAGPQRLHGVIVLVLRQHAHARGARVVPVALPVGHAPHGVVHRGDLIPRGGALEQQRGGLSARPHVRHPWRPHTLGYLSLRPLSRSTPIFRLRPPTCSSSRAPAPPWPSWRARQPWSRGPGP
mmetsp:Transcript_19144/g.47772  ORF Transcript_19144/g.47772 Transcript_19144/m.47772 type:complete len:427 (-) Transcript_19144:4364-5644(-)